MPLQDNTTVKNMATCMDCFVGSLCLLLQTARSEAAYLTSSAWDAKVDVNIQRQSRVEPPFLLFKVHSASRPETGCVDG